MNDAANYYYYILECTMHAVYNWRQFKRSIFTQNLYVKAESTLHMDQGTYICNIKE